MAHEYLKSKILKSKNQEGDNNQSGPQAGPSNIMDLPLDVDVAVKVNPDQLLPTAPGLGSTSESLVPSALSSITTLSTVSNITAINMEIAKNLTGFIQGTLHCQKHVLQRTPRKQYQYIQRSSVSSATKSEPLPSSTPANSETSTPINPFNSATAPTSEYSTAKSEPVAPHANISAPAATKSKTEPSPTNPATLLPIQHLSINQNALQQNQSQWTPMQQYQYLQHLQYPQQRSSVSSATKSEPLPANPASNSAVAPKSECSADTSETVAPNANISVPPATPKPQKSSESTFSFYLYFLDLMQQHAAELAAQGAALAAQRAALDRTIQDKDRLLREERAKRKADDESNKLMLQLQYKKDKQVQLQQQGLQQDTGVLRKQLADKSAEATRVASQLHDAEAMYTQHVLLDKAKDEQSRASAEQVQQ